MTATAVVRMRGDRLPGGCPAPVYPPHIPLPHLHGAGGPPPPWGARERERRSPEHDTLRKGHQCPAHNSCFFLELLRVILQQKKNESLTNVQ